MIRRQALFVTVGCALAFAVSGCGTSKKTAAPEHPKGPPSGVSTGQALYSISGATSPGTAAVDTYANAALQHAQPYVIAKPPESAPPKGKSVQPSVKGIAAPLEKPSPRQAESTIRADEGFWPGPFRKSVAVMEGAVQFVEAGETYVCSGTLMNSPNKSVVLTAGHCVHEGAPRRGTGKYHKNWLFAPGYRKGKTPYGWWKSRRLFSVNGWADDGNPRFDLGAAILQRKHGRTAGQVIADGQGIEWGYPASQGYWSFGYPAAPPFNGEKLAYCRSGLRTRYFPNSRIYRGKTYPAAGPVSGPAMIEIKCNMTGGASGGAWLAEFDGSHYGYVDGVNSLGDDRTMDSPYFGDAAKNLWNYVKGR